MRRIATYTGALLAAGLSSACCWAPLLLGSASAGALGLGATLEPFRPYLTGLTLAFLAVAFYLTYRPDRAECCAMRASPAKRFQKGVLWLVTLFALLTLLAPHLLARRAEHASVPAPSAISLQTVLLSVDRISCRSCATLIKQHLRETPGVHLVELDIPKRQVRIHYDPTLVQPEQLHQAIEQAGFPAKIIKVSQQKNSRQDTCCPTK